MQNRLRPKIFAYWNILVWVIVWMNLSGKGFISHYRSHLLFIQIINVRQHLSFVVLATSYPFFLDS